MRGGLGECDGVSVVREGGELRHLSRRGEWRMCCHGDGCMGVLSRATGRVYVIGV